MSELPFTKYQSIGNSFVLIERQDLDLPELAKKVCNPKFGIGADGLLAVDLNSNPNSLRMFNPDGTEDFCGNGLRCTAYHARFNGIEPKSILHGGREIIIKFDPYDWIDVSLPPYSFEPQDVPLRNGEKEIFEREIVLDGNLYKISSVSTGSTHTVIFKEPTESEFLKVSSILENSELFPNRTSVMWAWQTSDKQLSIRIWERGAGETLGCGTGTAAVAACWFRMHQDAMAISVKNPGGESVASKGPNNSVIISAKASRLFTGTYLDMAGVSPQLIQL